MALPEAPMVALISDYQHQKLVEPVQIPNNYLRPVGRLVLEAPWILRLTEEI
jgi:hypothetical protein